MTPPKLGGGCRFTGRQYADVASQSLQRWQALRLPGLTALDAQVAACVPGTVLADENLRGFVMLLSAHFQGFCRDLYTECVQAFVLNLPLHTQTIVQKSWLTDIRLNKSNPTVETLRFDFARMGFDPQSRLAANLRVSLWLTNLGEMNAWRNYAAHHNSSPPSIGPLTLVGVRTCHTACDGLATALDAELYTYLLVLLGVPPW